MCVQTGRAFFAFRLSLNVNLVQLFYYLLKVDTKLADLAKPVHNKKHSALVRDSTRWPSMSRALQVAPRPLTSRPSVLLSNYRRQDYALPAGKEKYYAKSTTYRLHNVENMV